MELRNCFETEHGSSGQKFISDDSFSYSKVIKMPEDENYLNIHNYIIPITKGFTKEGAKKAFESLKKEDMIELRLFEARLWEKYTRNKNAHGDLTKAYFNPFSRTLFIGFEGTTFSRLPKDIPLPKGWRVVIRNIWNEKYAYEYPKGQRWLLESDEYDKMETPLILDTLSYCLGNKIDLMQLEVWAYEIMEKNGEIAKGTVVEMRKWIKKK